MKRFAVLFLGATIAAGAAQAQAGAGCGMPGKNGNGDVASVIMACSALIQSGNDSGVSLALDYEVRGHAYFERDDCRNHGECGLAIGDFTRAIALDPEHNYRLLDERAETYENNGELGQFDLAVADYIHALKLEGATPEYGTSYDSYAGYYLGRDEFIVGRYGDASEDLALFVRHPDSNDSEYAVAFAEAILWLHLVRARAGTQDAAELSHNVSLMTRTAPWLGAIYKLYLGKSTPHEVFSAAAAVSQDGNSFAIANCYANFFVGEYELLRNNKKLAWDDLSDTATSCARKDGDDVFRKAASADMKRYNVQY